MYKGYDTLIKSMTKYTNINKYKKLIKKKHKNIKEKLLSFYSETISILSMFILSNYIIIT